MNHRRNNPSAFILVTPLFLLSWYASASGQTQWEIDPTLNALAGTWSGTMQESGGTSYCEAAFEWVLENAYLGGTLKVYHDAARRTESFFEQREFLKPSGENRYSLNRFDDRGVSSWGTYDVAGKTWKYLLKNSDGGEERGVMTWISGTSVDITGETIDGAGQVTKQYVFRLKKNP